MNVLRAERSSSNKTKDKRNNNSNSNAGDLATTSQLPANGGSRRLSIRQSIASMQDVVAAQVARGACVRACMCWSLRSRTRACENT